MKHQLTWRELEELIIKEYADECIVIEAMRGFMRLVPLKDVTPGDLGARPEKLATLSFSEDIRSNVIMQVQLTES